MLRYALPVLFLVAAGGIAQPPGGDVVIVPPAPPVPALTWEPVKGEAKVGSDITLSIGAKAEWRLIDANGPTLRMSADGMSAILRSEKEGPVRIAVTPDGGRTQFRVVNVSGPPAPPIPNPLRDRLRAAWTADADPDKHERAKDLAELYRQCAKLAESPDVLTSGALLETLRKASAAMIGPAALVNLRKAVAAELAAILPDDAPLTEDQRRRLAALFRDMAAILEAF